MKILVSLIALLCVPTELLAQQAAPLPSKSFTQRRCCVRRLPKRIPTTTTTPAAPRPPTEAPSDFFVGEARVDVTKDDTVVRLAMAQHGSVFIELPANDGPRYIIPGDPEMATVDEEALEKNKRAIIVRPGSLFLPPLPRTRARTPAATVTVQMRSGLVVTFLFYPVENLAQNVHRCVLNYRRDEVVARRRAAGLPVNLDEEQVGEKTTEQSAAPTSISVESPEENHAPTKDSSATPKGLLPTEMGFKLELVDTSPMFNASSEISDTTTTKEANKTFAKALLSARKTLKQAMKARGQFRDWTKPVHGLALSVVQQRYDSEDFSLIILAVRNVTIETLKLTPGSPDLFVEILDDHRKPVNVESIKKLYTEASDVTGVISAGGTLYYAIAYVPPILGVHQQVKAVVSQTNAADEPASVTIAKR